MASVREWGSHTGRVAAVGLGVHKEQTLKEGQAHGQKFGISHLLTLEDR